MASQTVSLNFLAVQIVLNCSKALMETLFDENSMESPEALQ